MYFIFIFYNHVVNFKVEDANKSLNFVNW